MASNWTIGSAVLSFDDYKWMKDLFSTYTVNFYKRNGSKRIDFEVSGVPKEVIYSVRDKLTTFSALILAPLFPTKSKDTTTKPDKGTILVENILKQTNLNSNQEESVRDFAYGFISDFRNAIRTKSYADFEQFMESKYKEADFQDSSGWVTQNPIDAPTIKGGSSGSVTGSGGGGSATGGSGGSNQKAATGSGGSSSSNTMIYVAIGIVVLVVVMMFIKKKKSIKTS